MLVLAGLAALVPLRIAVASAAGGICEGVVLDYGTGSSPAQPAETVVQGPSVPPGTSDLEAMDDAGDSVSQNDSGLVCAINGYPANGVQDCTAKSGNDFYYWSYWQGNPYTNTWTYANIGPAEHEVQDGGTYVEGWHFQNPGPDNASAPPPSISPSAAFARACPGVTPQPTSPGGGSPTPTTTTAPTTPTPTTPTTPTTAAKSGGGSTATTIATTSHSTTPATTAAAGHGSTGTGGTTTTSASSDQTTTSPTAAKSHRTGTTAAALSGTSRRSSSSPILPIALVAAVIVVLGAITYFRWRKRPVEGE
jgi:hypothetical protein